MGYIIREYYIKNKRSPNKYILGYLLTTLTIFFITECSVRGRVILENKLYFYEYTTPFVILGSISLFIAFTNININSNIISNIIDNTFNIYLIHVFVLEFIKVIEIRCFVILPNPIVYIPLISFITFISSYMISIGILSIYNIFIKKGNQ